MIAFCAAVIALLGSVAALKYALTIPSAAGAGAAGGIVLLASIIMGFTSIFMFGFALGSFN